MKRMFNFYKRMLQNAIIVLIHKEEIIVNFTTGSFQKGKTTILPVFIDQHVDQLGLQLKKYHGERKDHVVWFDHEGTRFVVVGLGAQSKFNMNKFRDAAAYGARAAIKEGEQEVTL